MTDVCESQGVLRMCVQMKVGKSQGGCVRRIQSQENK